MKIYLRQYGLQKYLTSLRPYATAFTSWIKSDKTDQSHLLKGKELELVTQWMKDRSLPSEDYDFIVASQSLQSLRANERAEEAEEKRQKLAKNNQRLGGQLGGQRTQQKMAEERLLERESILAERGRCRTNTKRRIEETCRRCQTTSRGCQTTTEAHSIAALATRQAETSLLSPDQSSDDADGCIGCMALIGATAFVVLSVRFTMWIL